VYNGKLYIAYKGGGSADICYNVFDRCCALRHQLDQGLAGGRSVEDAPNAVACGNIDALDLRHLAD
jgi:hypothetical protein